MKPRGGVLWRQCTALFGGSFDPPHLGHREAIRGLLTRPGVGRVVVLPSAAPPQKAASASSTQRLELLRLTLEGCPAEISDLEQRRALRSPGTPSYTYDTLLEARTLYGDSLAFVIGTDQLTNLSTWHRFPEILGLCHWIVLKRRGAPPFESALQSFQASGLLRPSSRPAPETGAEAAWTTRGAAAKGDRELLIVPTDAPEVSSTAIRSQIARTGHPPEGVFPPQVVEYLKLHRIYGTTSP